jgi:exosortase K
MKNIRKRDIAVYLIGVIISILTYDILNKNISVSLLPHKIAIEFLCDYHFIFIPKIGYQEVEGLFVIAKNCLGTKLFVSLFLILLFGFLHEYKNICHKMIATAYFYLLSIALAFIITVTRIYVSIPFCTFENFSLIHNAISLVIYFISGFILYFIMENRRCFVCKSY